MNCPHCGAVNADEARLCHRCGAELAPASAGASSAAVVTEGKAAVRRPPRRIPWSWLLILALVGFYLLVTRVQQVSPPGTIVLIAPVKYTGLWFPVFSRAPATHLSPTAPPVLAASVIRATLKPSHHLVILINSNVTCYQRRLHQSLGPAVPDWLLLPHRNPAE